MLEKYKRLDFYLEVVSKAMVKKKSLNKLEDIFLHN